MELVLPFVQNNLVEDLKKNLQVQHFNAKNQTQKNNPRRLEKREIRRKKSNFGLSQKDQSKRSGRKSPVSPDAIKD